MLQSLSSFCEQASRSRILTPEQERRLVELAESIDGSEESAAAELARQAVAAGLLTRYQAEKLSAGRFRELRIGPYILTELIGVGGMGSVYAAIDETQRQPLAVKLLSSDFKYDAGMRTRFRMEAAAGQLVRHPNLVRTISHGTTDDVFGEMDYMAMELFRGIALHELLSVHGPLSWSMACDVIIQAAAGLQQLHSAGLIHRDVKPDNLLVDREGRVKLIDYGLALSAEAVRDGKVLQDGEEFSLTMLFGHDCLGTPEYMAPEQAADSLTAGPPSDVYALGCTLYTLLTARRPYQAPNKAQLIAAHRQQPVPHVSVLVPVIPQELDAVVARMMAKSPAERFPSMDDVVLALAPFAARQPVRFEYADLLQARRRLAERKSSIARMAQEGRTLSSLRNKVLAEQLETGVATETLVDGKPVPGVVRPASKPTAAHSTVETAAEAIAAYAAEPASDAPVLARLSFSNGLVVPIRGLQFAVGRLRNNDLVLPVADLSSRHCTFNFDGERWILRDLDSRNGVRINGKRIKEEFLKHGDVVVLGSTTQFRFEIPGQERSFWRMAGVAAGIVIAAAAGALLWWWLG